MTNVLSLSGDVPEKYSGYRLDKALAEMFPDYSRSRIQQWIKGSRVWVDGEVIKPKNKLLGGEHIEIDVAVNDEISLEAQPVPLDIAFEDETVIVINKPVGMVVHPGAGNPDGTLLNGLLYHDSGLAQIPRAGIVHRLDKDTTGLLVVAKTLQAHKSLVEQLQDRTVSRHYQALVNGVMTAGGTIDEPIGRHPVDRKRMAVNERGREAITHYRVNKRYPAHTLVDVKLETGRTHQIRVHMSYIHYPIVGDPVYGGRARFPAGCSEKQREAISAFNRQALHARELSFLHPLTEEEVSFEVPLPDDFADLMDVLESADE